MKRILTCLAMFFALVPLSARAAESADPIGDLLAKVAAHIAPILESVGETFGLKATLYHTGHGIGERDAIGCQVVPMRTAAVDGVEIPKHTVLFIKETVGLPLPGGGVHDGYWYASDTGGAIHKGRIDLFTGRGAASMTPLMALNLATLTVTEIGKFSGCPHA
ncbi:MAG: 3D domain-containing protein [Caulobacteraceae bacterium]